MKNITLAIDEAILKDAREIAHQRGTTLNAMVREYLGQLASQAGRTEVARARLRELIDKSTAELGPDFKWNREELYEDRLLPRHERPGVRSRRKAG